MKSPTEDYCGDLATVVAKWEGLRTKDLQAANAQLAARNLAPLPVPPSAAPPACEATPAKKSGK